MSITTVENTFGAILIGCIIAVFLFGIVTVQCYMYFDKYEEDHYSFKGLVCFILFFTGFVIQAV